MKRERLREHKATLTLTRREITRNLDEIEQLEKIINDSRRKREEIETQVNIGNSKVFALNNKISGLENAIRFLETGERTEEQKTEAKKGAARLMCPLSVFADQTPTESTFKISTFMGGKYGTNNRKEWKDVHSRKTKPI